jgi:hypothetical protein
MSKPEVTYRGPAPEPAPLAWELKLFLLAMALVFVGYAFMQWWETP